PSRRYPGRMPASMPFKRSKHQRPSKTSISCTQPLASFIDVPAVPKKPAVALTEPWNVPFRRLNAVSCSGNSANRISGIQVLPDSEQIEIRTHSSAGTEIELGVHPNFFVYKGLLVVLNQAALEAMLCTVEFAISYCCIRGVPSVAVPNSFITSLYIEA